MLDRAQPGEQGVELGIGEEQGITAGEKHIAHLGVFFEVAEGSLELGVQFLLAHAEGALRGALERAFEHRFALTHRRYDWTLNALASH